MRVEMDPAVFDDVENGRPIVVCGRRYIPEPVFTSASRLIDTEPACDRCGHWDRWHPKLTDPTDLVCAGSKCVCRKRQP